MKHTEMNIAPRRAKLTLVAIILVTIAAILAVLYVPYFVGKAQLRKEHPLINTDEILEISKNGDIFFVPCEKSDGKWYLEAEKGTTWQELAKKADKEAEIYKIYKQYRRMLPGLHKNAVNAYAQEYFCGTRYEGAEKSAVYTQLIKALVL